MALLQSSVPSDEDRGINDRFRVPVDSPDKRLNFHTDGGGTGPDVSNTSDRVDQKGRGG